MTEVDGLVLLGEEFVEAKVVINKNRIETIQIETTKENPRTEKIVIPGLINAHTHVAMIKFRGLGVGLPTDYWLKKVIWPMERTWTKSDVERWSLLGIAEAVSLGSTTINDHYFFAEATAEAAKKVGVRAFIGNTVMDMVEMPGAEWSKARNFTKRVKSELIRPTLAPHATNTVSKELLEEIVAFSKERNIPIHMHVAQSLEEIKWVKENYRTGPIEFLDSISALGKEFIGVHGTYLSKKELIKLGLTGSTLIHCPTSNLLLEGKTTKPMIVAKAGGKVGLGSDSPNPVGTLDLLREAMVSSLVGTVKGAMRLAFSDVLNFGGGAIGVGRSADLVVFNVRNTRGVGKLSLENMPFVLSGADVELVIVNGTVIYDNKYFPKLRKSLEDLWRDYSEQGF